jgi:hypothetical protein
MKIDWPNKAEREGWEIEQFIYYYSLFHPDSKLIITESREMPDYFVCDELTKTLYGVELTSVYIDNLSVPEYHIKSNESEVEVPYSKEALGEYIKRILEHIQSKIQKAKKHYDQSHPLILSVYVNEYISLYIRRQHLQEMIDNNSHIFDGMTPFVEMILWPLPSPDEYPEAMLIRPD